MRIAYITAGAAGMYCGSCMRDNTLCRRISELGHDVLLIPTYTPIRTDEEDVSEPHVFFGGINVYLEQKFWLFRHTPWFLDRLLELPRPARAGCRGSPPDRSYSDLGELTVSMLEGAHGNQARRSTSSSVAAAEFKPEVCDLTERPALGRRAGAEASAWRSRLSPLSGRRHLPGGAAGTGPAGGAST